MKCLMNIYIPVDQKKGYLNFVDVYSYIGPRLEVPKLWGAPPAGRR
jgi:hypothetical protein